MTSSREPNATSPSPPPPSPPAGRAGMIAVVGRANVGKSSLVNALVEEKVSIVSPVAQTTRNRIRGIWTGAGGQLVFLDTPGIHQADHDLGQLMNRMARHAAEGADIVLLVLDATASPRIEDEGWLRRLSASDAPLVLALNKMDAVTAVSDQRLRHRELWDRLRRQAAGPTPRHEWLELSARTGVGVGALRQRLLEMAPAGPLLFPEDMLSDFPRKLMIADIVREQLFRALDAELPYAIAVAIDTLVETGKGWSAEGEILVNKPSQKGIVIGNKGRRLKRALLEAERELADIYERPVALRLRVGTHKNWARDPALLRRLGYTT